MVPVLLSTAAVTVVGALRNGLPMLKVVVLLSVPPTVTLLPPSPLEFGKPVSTLNVPLLVRLTPEAVVSATFSCTSKSPVLAAEPEVTLSTA